MATSAMVVPADEIAIPADVDGPPPAGWTPQRPVVVTTPTTTTNTGPGAGRSQSGRGEQRIVIQVEPQPLSRQNSVALYDYAWSGPPAAEDDWSGPPVRSNSLTRAEKKKDAPPFEPLRSIFTRRGVELHCHEGRLMGCLRFLLSAAGAVCSAIVWIAMLKAKQTELRWNNVAAFVGLVTINVATTFWCLIHIPINFTYVVYRQHPCGLCCGWFAFLVDTAIALLSFAAASASVGVTQYTRLPGGICYDLKKSVDTRRFCNRTAGATGFAFITWAFVILPLAILSSWSLGRKLNMRLVQYPSPKEDEADE